MQSPIFPVQIWENTENNIVAKKNIIKIQIKIGKKYYIGTFVVPIRIELSRLFYMKEDMPYHVIGFLCLDSLSKNAFLNKQEKYNAEIIKSFADIFYVALSKYGHYLQKIQDAKNVNVTNNQ